MKIKMNEALLGPFFAISGATTNNESSGENSSVEETAPEDNIKIIPYRACPCCGGVFKDREIETNKNTFSC